MAWAGSHSCSDDTKNLCCTHRRCLMVRERIGFGQVRFPKTENNRKNESQLVRLEIDKMDQ
ncbi:hypothetical protein BpHYR1_008611 [Brachionus plicatilis]|uniref:Uncharacterized protein n=1 Tax=Brachionus plicatilis TaxID=10195 RepID=A0A3M7RA67_BRAPC|nr:hypothetical protein BpHYR1_008611 [Brachionus plicatilis]